MKAKAGPSILALIPAWNEAPRVGAVVRGAAVYLPVLVVDDGSEDETAQVAEAAGATVVRHSENRGKGVALMTGFAWAKERSYDAVLTLDADGQHDPEDIPKLVAAYQAGAGDLIVGRRNFSQMPFPRFFTNPFGSWLLSLALGYTVHAGFYLFTAFVGLNLLQSGLTRWCPAMWILKKAGMKDCSHQAGAK